ncbi:cadherin-related family member 5 [Larimichthys crocea]|uniref:cadherin-related family member 5 n=1 Tax=Larimichthys crocea TaxID=215358 RepID=UPI000F5E125D|nr:cadherin-related family member 5-like [Larimichthys crocea]
MFVTQVQGSVLIAELTCSEDGVIQSQYRILVEIVNENDNRPKFLKETIQPFTISELTTVNSVVFTVKAIDTDGDMITYIIDQSLPDASFFRIDLPNSGNVVLNKPLDYETRTQLKVILWAQETNTVDKFNTSAVLTVNIEDGDDQYPHFLPCTPVTPGVPVCMNPTYTTNITHKQQGIVLEFSPGPIRAEDGDRGINTPLIYTILSGDDQGRFVINNSTGEIRLTRPLNSQPVAANFTLNIMVCQVDDRLKYSLASALIRVLSENIFPPVFNRTTFKGFIIQSSSPASIVSTYGNQVLQVQVSDRDFTDGLNPNIHYALNPPSGLYQVTQGGVLIAKTDKLRAFDRHILQVVARDEESGEEVSASVDVEVLQRGQAVPRGAFTEQQLFGDMDSRLAGGIAAMILLLFLSSVLFLLLRTVKRRRQTNTDEHTAISLGKHPNVSLLGFEMVSSSQSVFSVDETSYNNRACSPSESFHGRQGVYTRKHSQLPLPPSSSSSSSTSNLVTGDPGGRSTLHSNLFSVQEKSEGPPEVTKTIETLRLSDVREAIQTTCVSTGESTGGHDDDITAVNTETLQRHDMKTNQGSGERLQETEDLYR